MAIPFHAAIMGFISNGYYVDLQCQEDSKWIWNHMHSCMDCYRNVTRTVIDHCSLWIELGENNVWSKERGGWSVQSELRIPTRFLCYAGAKMHSGHSLLLSLIRIFPHPFPLPSCLLHLLHVPLLFHLILYYHVSSLLTKLLFHPHFLHLSKHHIHINRHRWRTIRYRVAQVQNLLDDSISVIILYILLSLSVYVH